MAYSLFDDLAVLLTRWFGRVPAEPATKTQRDTHRQSPADDDNGETQWLKRDDETIVVHREQPHEKPPAEVSRPKS